MTKKIKLYSLDPQSYPNIEIECEVIEDTAAKLEEITAGTPFVAVKTAVVQARKAQLGDVVDTRPRTWVDGRVYTFSETKQTISQEKVDQGAIIVTNPDGEEYVIKSEEKFMSKYKKVEGGFAAIDGPKKFAKASKNCTIKTSWGEEQIVPEGSYLCVSDKDDIYSVTNEAFEKTYSAINRSKDFTNS